MTRKKRVVRTTTVTNVRVKNDIRLNSDDVPLVAT